MAIDNLARPYAELEKLIRRVERLERAAPLGFSSISRGALRILSEEGLIVEGSARISGILNGDGTLQWDGSITFTGPFTIDGVTVQNGDYTVNGAWHFIGNGDIAGDVTMTGVFDLTGNANLSGTVTITGPLSIEGDTTLTGNMTVTTGGKITVEGPSAATLENGELSFATGGKVLAYPQGVAMEAGLAEVTASAAGAYLWFGTKHIAVTSGGAFVSGALELQGTLAAPGLDRASSAHTPNLWFNAANNRIYVLP